MKHNEWLARYPRPLRCIHDAGGEFTGGPFQDTLELSNGITDVPSAIKNPQANVICERMHQKVGNVLCTLLACSSVTQQGIAGTNAMMNTCLAMAMHATRASRRVHRHRSLLQKSSSGALVFQRDMFLDIPLVGYVITIQEH
jgi:hypothetical protein